MRNRFDMTPDTASMLGMMIGGDVAEVVERHGQSRLREGRVVHLARNMDKADRDNLTTLGFTFPDEGDGEKDRLLMPVSMPVGWTTRPTGHGMYTDLVDPRGYKRGVIGYKGAFWDRWAAFYLVRRFNVSHEYAQHMEKDMPPEIAALQITERVAKVVEPTERELERNRPSVYGYDDYKGGRYYMDDGIMYCRMDPPKPKVVYEDVVRNTFDPYRNKAHATLPYKRYYITDSTTGKRVWEGPWISRNQDKEIEESNRVKLPGKTGKAWMLKHYPDYNNVLAYW